MCPHFGGGPAHLGRVGGVKSPRPLSPETARFPMRRFFNVFFGFNRVNRSAGSRAVVWPHVPRPCMVSLLRGHVPRGRGAENFRPPTPETDRFLEFLCARVLGGGGTPCNVPPLADQVPPAWPDAPPAFWLVPFLRVWAAVWWLCPVLANVPPLSENMPPNVPPHAPGWWHTLPHHLGR